MYAELVGLLDAQRLAHEARCEGTGLDSCVCVVCFDPTAIGRVHYRDRVRRCMRFTA